MELKNLKKLLLLLCICVFINSCEASVIYNNGYGGFTTRRITPQRNVTRTYTTNTQMAPTIKYISPSVSTQSHIMTPSVTHTTVPTPGYSTTTKTIYNYNTYPSTTYSPYYQSGTVLNNQTGTVVKYPVNNLPMNNYYYQSMPTVTTVTPLTPSTHTTTYSNGNITHTYTEEYYPSTNFYINRGNFLHW